jgi:hypothetical protein
MHERAAFHECQQSELMQLMRALVVLHCLLAGFAHGAEARQYQTNSIEGWTVLVDERLLAEDKAPTKKALELLRAQLKEIVRVVPASAVAKLREVTLWFSLEYSGVKPKAEYHPDIGCLRERSQRGHGEGRGVHERARFPGRDESASRISRCINWRTRITITCCRAASTTWKSQPYSSAQR